MPKFSMTQLLMAMALIAILLVLLRSDRISGRYATIESLCFSSDGSRLIVSKLTARDAEVPLKMSKTDIKKTLSSIDVASKVPTCTVLHGLNLDTSGFATQMWPKGRRSVASFSGNGVAIGSFNSNTLLTVSDNSKPTTAVLSHPANYVVAAKSSDLIAVSGGGKFTVLDAKSKNEKLGGTRPNKVFLWSTPMAFSEDGGALYVSNDTGIDRWDLESGQKAVVMGSPYLVEDMNTFTGIATGPENSLVVCGNKWVRHYDEKGDLLSDLLPRGCSLCDSSVGGKHLVVANYDHVACFRMNDRSLRHEIVMDQISALAISPDGKHVAVGGEGGFVSLYDFETGKQIWKVQPQGRLRLVWPIPFGFLLLWFIAAVMLFRRWNRSRPPQVEVTPQ